MSVLYPDLISTFPENLDTFPNYQNITPADGNLIAQYMEAMNQGNQVLANQILAQIPNATQKIIKATDLNKVMQAVLATERFFKDDIYDYILEQQENWQEIINQFAYVGTYSSGNTYNKYNMVDYTVSGVKLLYIATNSVPAGTPPTSTNYWRVLTIQGTEGEPGQGLSYRQEWQPSVQYDVNQAVTYSGILWMALQPNLGIEPGTNDEIWKKVMDFSVVVYPIQPTPPTNQAIGGLWFNTEDNPTNYAYLSPLSNPATASEVIVGYQAYDEGGNVLNGTAQPASGDYVLKSEVNQPNGVAGLDENGLILVDKIPTLNYIPTSEKGQPNGVATLDENGKLTESQRVPSTGSILKITFDIQFEGEEYTITSQNGTENFTGAVPQGLIVEQIVKQINMEYTIQISNVTKTISTGDYFSVYTVDVVPNPTLNQATWAEIRAASDNGTASSLWAVGDAKQIDLSGKTIGTVTYDDFKPWVYILGFNHNASVEGNNMIHFGCFRTEENYSATNGIALDDSEYDTQTSTQLAFHMNTTNINIGGWENSIMRTTVLNSNASNPSSASVNSFLAALPSDLKAVLKQCTKYSDNTGGGNDTSSYVTATQDWVFLLSEFEVQGTRTYANSAEQTKQLQYEYYINGNSKIKYKQSFTSTSLIWWLRSVDSAVTSYFCFVYSSGGASDFYASISYGLAPAFCV